MKCGPDAGEDPFPSVKESTTDLISDLIKKLQSEDSSKANHKPDRDDEMAKACEKTVDLETPSLKLFGSPASGTVQLNLDLCAVSAQQLNADAMHVDERELCHQPGPVPNPTTQVVDHPTPVPRVMPTDVVVLQRRVPTILRVEKGGEVPQVQYNDKVVNVPVVLQRNVPTVYAALKTVEVPQIQHMDKVVDVPVVSQRQVPITVEDPQIQFLDRVDDVPLSVQRSAPIIQEPKTVNSPQVQFIDRAVNVPFKSPPPGPVHRQGGSRSSHDARQLK